MQATRKVRAMTRTTEVTTMMMMLWMVFWRGSCTHNQYTFYKKIRIHQLDRNAD
jgi:hypothetical protein